MDQYNQYDEMLKDLCMSLISRLKKNILKYMDLLEQMSEQSETMTMEELLTLPAEDIKTGTLDSLMVGLRHGISAIEHDLSMLNLILNGFEEALEPYSNDHLGDNAPKDTRMD